LKSRFSSIYTKEKSNLTFAKDKAGVYLIKQGDTVVYIGYSASNLQKTCLRHFQQWNDTTQVRCTYDRRKCLVRLVITTPERAAKLERALIVKMQPKDNPDKMPGYKLKKIDYSILDEYDHLTLTPHKVLVADWEDAPF